MNQPNHQPNHPDRQPPAAVLNTARAQNATDLRPVPPDGGKPGPIHTPRYDEFLRRTTPSRQKSAKAYLDGKAPGVMQSYAPDAKVSDVEGWVEDEQTVRDLAKWREEAIY